MDIAAEGDLNPELADPRSLARRVLVFAPHPDDEAFGCGGTLGLLAAAGADITVVVISDGALGGNSPGLVEERESESRAAAQVLGYPAPTFWRLPDRGLSYGEALVTRLQNAIAATDADLVLAPSTMEIHPDHQVTALAMVEAMRRLGGARRLALYEVSAPLLPNVVVDITPVESDKLEAMRCFQSQLAQHPYDESIAALNRYRAYHLDRSMRSAEAFFIATAASLDHRFTPLFDSAPARRRRLGFAATGSDIPLVSVLLRSMDRPSLGEVLDSVALQTYANIEVVVINAKGALHGPLDNHCGRFPLRVINRDGPPLSPPRAANAGLDAALGEYLAVLDDNDALDPDHLSHLVTSIQKERDAVVGYAGVRCVNGNDPERKTPRIFAEQPGDIATPLAEDAIPVHALLFPRTLLEHARFDESLDRRADRDFCLQLARHARFVYVNRVTSTCLLDSDAERQPLGPGDAHPNVSAVGGRDQADQFSPVAVLLCSMHGQHFIAAQLESIAAQTHADWTLWISDDGSQDDTHQIIEAYLSKWGAARISVQAGPTRGYAANFLALTCQDEIRARYYAYADQDDIWEPDKLARAIAWLRNIPAGVPALYCSRTRLIDEQGREIGFSPLIRKPPSFANALVQNIGGGNTIVFNEAARNLLRALGKDARIVAHDWWAYQVVTGCGGQVLYDPYPGVRYRQHVDNLVGSNARWSDKFWRLKEVLKGRYRAWNDINIAALQSVFPRLTAENQRILEEFRVARKRSLIPRLLGIRRCGVYRQGLLGNIGLALATVLKRI